MENTKKITKAMVLEVIKTNVENMIFDGDVAAEDVIAYVDTTIAQLEAKNAKAKEKAAEKRANGDELRDKIQSLLTNEFQTITDIAAQIDDEEATTAKITARLTQLVNAEIAVKEQVKVEKGKKMAYKLA